MQQTEHSGVSVQVAVFGDSIAAGLGARGGSYASLLSERFGYEVVDFSGTAKMVDESFRELCASAISPDWAIIDHGATEAIVRPRNRRLWFLPRRWRKLGWMDPRPYYPTKRWERCFKYLESEMRWRVKVLCIRFLGSEVLMSQDSYRVRMESLVAELRRRGARVILVQPGHIDERFFPGSSQSMSSYFSAISTENVGVVLWVDAANRWSGYLADHFHPNGLAHAAMAKILNQYMRSVVEDDR